MAAKEGNGLSLLVVEDEDSIGTLLASILTMEGHRVRLGKTAGEGLRLFDAEPSDMVITDLGLPDQTGWEVARHVKQARPGTPVILITGWGYMTAEHELERRGVDSVLQKPFEFQELIALIDKVRRRPEP
jgi:DNA-binding response OmpR family regulator